MPLCYIEKISNVPMQDISHYHPVLIFMKLLHDIRFGCEIIFYEVFVECTTVCCSNVHFARVLKLTGVLQMAVFGKLLTRCRVVILNDLFDGTIVDNIDIGIVVL
jgi:hypothetical protein